MKTLPPAGSRPNRVMLGIATLILLAIVGLSYREWRQYSRANAEAASSQEISESVERLLAGLLDAETGQRGFLLTGDIQYLEPYNRAVQTVPSELGNLEKLLAPRPRQSATVKRLDGLVNQKMAELRQTIDLRRTQGTTPALDLVLSGQGKRTMDEIRTVSHGIRSQNSVALNEASRNGESAAQIALLVTTFGSLILLFFFVAGVEPVMSGDPRAKQRPKFLVYGVPFAVTAAITLLRMALNPAMGDTGATFIMFLPTVLFAAWYGGPWCGALTILLSTLATDYYFTTPARTFLVSNPVDQIHMLLFITVGAGMVLLSHSQRRALERADRESARRGEAENAEREQRQRLETTLRSIGDAVISTDAEGRILFANPVALSLLRCSGPDVAGKHLDEVFQIVNEFSREKVESPVTKAMREATIVGLANHTVLIARDGTEIPIDDSGAPIRDESGTILGAVMVFRDVTERRLSTARLAQLNSDLQKSNERLVHLNKDFESFAFVASHDLQEPLRMMTAYAQLLVNSYSGQLDKDATLYVSNIIEGTRRMRELLQDLLAYMEVGAIPEGPLQPVDLNLAMEAVKQNLKLSIAESGAVITCDPLPTLSAYQNHLVPLFQNLIGNAIKYKNNAPPRIHISIEDRDDHWRFAIADNGMGVSPEHHAKIFEAFKRLHGSEIRGTGVGLAICQRVVERYGGRIWVESQLAQGATFLFNLPKSGPSPQAG